MTPLQNQLLIHASPKSKIKHSILSKALVDALGGPAEFQDRFTFELITEMQRNRSFGLGPGTWTDDTSMALCLARSIAKGVTKTGAGGGFNELDQLNAYTLWSGKGYLSAAGYCFDIGTTTRIALRVYRSMLAAKKSPEEALKEIKRALDKENYSGNGSLMRVLPVGLAFWRAEDQTWKDYARRSSETTHPYKMCVEACEVWTGAIVKIMRANANKEKLNKLEMFEYFATFPYTVDKLKAALICPVPPSADLESHYSEHHPILRLIHTVAGREPSQDNPLKLPTDTELPSSGYVLETLVAALYCFFSTETFEQGAIAAVNLGGDADTVGAIYGGLAGCWYSIEEENDEDRVFWTDRVKEWRNKLVKRNVVEAVAMELVKFDDKMESNDQ